MSEPSREADPAVSPAIPRLLPDRPFPPYAYVPRRGLAHPTADPAGHSFGAGHEVPPALVPERWSDSAPYLLGIDLFNHGYYWESHVAWEGLWLACGRRGPVADFLRALIKLAAAGVKHREGVPAGVRTHARRAAELWRGVAGTREDGPEPDPFLGLRLPDLIALADSIARDGWPDCTVQLRPEVPGPGLPT